MSFLDSLTTQDPLESDQLPQPLIPSPPPSASALSPSQSITSTTRDTTNIINITQGPSMPNYASHAEGDDQNDKFATLFNPSTPRASPTSYSTSLSGYMESKGNFDQPSRLKPHIQRHSRANSTASEHSDFGAFVSVSAFEDPLAANTSTFDQEWEDVPAAAAASETASLNTMDSAHEAAEPSPHASASSRSTSRSRNPPSKASNSTLSFFDQFAQDAKERSSKTRSLVLDELLLHEDDPLYFLKDQQQGGETVHSDEAGSSIIPDDPDSAKTMVPPLPFHAKSTPIIDLHSDLDHDYFRPISKTPQKDVHHPTPSRSSSFAVAEPRLAPPIASPEGATRTDFHLQESTAGSSSNVLSHQVTVSPPPMEEDETPNDARGHLIRSPSHQSLSTSISSLPGRWMSTLLRGSSPPTEHTINQGARPALESIFNLSTPSDNDPGSHLNTSQTLKDKSDSDRTASPQRQRQLVQPNFTHTSAFAPLPPSTSSTLSVTHSSSPFAPHVYVPPTGAPGFSGEGYDWDKGFSDELEAEREREQGLPDRGRETNRGNGRDLRRDNVKAKTIPSYETRGEPPEMATTLSSTSKSGWGSGFGFWNGKFKGTGSNPSNTSIVAHDDSHPALEPPRLARDRDATRTWDGSSSLGTEGRLSDPNAVSDLPPSGDAGLGAFIERKSGNVDLVGRRAMTTPVLTPELAGEVSPCRFIHPQI